MAEIVVYTEQSTKFFHQMLEDSWSALKCSMVGKMGVCKKLETSSKIASKQGEADLKRLGDLGSGPLLHGALRLEVEDEGVRGVGWRLRAGPAHHRQAAASSPASDGACAGEAELLGDAAREEGCRGGRGEQIRNNLSPFLVLLKDLLNRIISMDVRLFYYNLFINLFFIINLFHIQVSIRECIEV
ncbi:hypothetical protein EJB05_34983 [Eragrostis curvula]|uniref:Uncharacterized protein n=1 Tax=Eragrostis curvula TaxID=38414 RepID=A0A5J9U5L3_9POAL|nr:hypothetical protein EJB05_34983 [Eragrostis curvula]